MRSVIPVLATGISPSTAPKPRARRPRTPPLPPLRLFLHSCALSFIPAQAGTQAISAVSNRPNISPACPGCFHAAAERLRSRRAAPTAWIPACAGMKERERAGLWAVREAWCATRRDTRGKHGYDGRRRGLRVVVGPCARLGAQHGEIPVASTGMTGSVSRGYGGKGGVGMTEGARRRRKRRRAPRP